MFKEYIFFDLDGTLTDSQKGITSCVQKSLLAVGIEENDYSNLLRFIGPPLQNSFREFYGLGEDEITRAIEVYHEFYDEKGLYENTPYTGIREMLKTLQDGGKKLYVATSKPEWMANRILEHFELASYFTLICGNHPGLTTKADVIRDVIAREQLADKKEQILMVGDRHHDVDGAKEVGIDCLGVSWGFAVDGELMGAGAIHVVDTPSEAAQWILEGMKSISAK